MSKQIKIGDIVDVYFSDSPRLLNLEVLGMIAGVGVILLNSVMQSEVIIK